MKRQVSVIELFGFDDDGEHVQEFFNEILANYKAIVSLQNRLNLNSNVTG